MKLRFHLSLITVLISSFCFAQTVDLTYYLPDIKYDSAIPTPKSILGYQMGDWHISHDQLVNYMRILADKSDRVTLEEYARSHEQRPLILLTITSKKNHQNLKAIQKQHLALCNPDQSAKIDIASMPAVVYQGYSIHGNESSGANAAVLVAYYLAAGQGKEVESLLDELVILVDPCFNPDGLHRFSTWVNMHKSKNKVSDPQSREFNEVWPGGRTNHYWFDLNRDWLLVQHPESQGRIQKFHQWKPNILTDHHEMGSNASYFFQPGVASRTNPITPQKNQDLTEKIATFHAKQLDQIGSLYYSKESFDDFYYGKGSTYPDVNGCMGILFEQASSRGHLRETDNGLLSFPFTIRNQVRTSLSTQKAGRALRKDLLEFQRNFYQNAQKEAQQSKVKGYVFGEQYDVQRLKEFVHHLEQHQIEVHQIKKDIRIAGNEFKKDYAFLVPMAQDQYRLIRAIFEKTTSFKDSLFYDVSSWTLPLAYNLDYAPLENKNIGGLAGAKVKSKDIFQQNFNIVKSDYAYLFKWDNYYAPNALNELLLNKLNVNVSMKPFSATTTQGLIDFEAGTIRIAVQNQLKNPVEIYQLMKQISQKNQLKIYTANTGLTPTGIDLGSPSFRKVKPVKVLLLVEDGVNSYDAGEVWHLLDQRYDMQLTMIASAELSGIDLSKYSSLVMVDGFYGSIEKSGIEKLKSWLSAGGTLIAMKRAARWAKSKGLAALKFKSKKASKKKQAARAYKHLAPDNGSKFIGGAIFETELDISHPLGFGYHKAILPIFRRGTLFFEPSKNPYAMPLRYTSKPLLSGYISKDNLTLIQSSASIIVSRLGAGKIICMADNPNFREFWYGTNKLFANAIFFGNLISGQATEQINSSKKEVEEEAQEH